MGTSRPSLSKRKFMEIHQNLAVKHLVFLGLSLFYATSVVSGKNNHSNADCHTRTSEFTNNQNRPYVGSEAHGRLVKAAGDRDWIPNFKELKRLMSKLGQSSGPSSSASKTSKPSKDWKSKQKGQPTATPMLIYEDSRREVVKQCIANLMSTVHLYPHSEVIASSFTERFEDMLRWLYETDKANRDSCKHWRGWTREKFVEHLRLLYPQLSNAADKSYLEMIKEIPFQYDLDNPVLE